MKFLILAGIIFRLIALNCSGLWLDEAYQFWVSKGIDFRQLYNLDVLPQDVELRSLIKNSYWRLLGSPTYTILIHCWSKISDSVPWLRIIPCLFGIGSLLLIYLIASGVGFSKKWALAITAFSAWNNPWVHYSVELRPYSFEIFSSALTLLFLIKILKSKNILISHCAWLALSILIGITSGYGYFIYYPFILIFLLFYVMLKDIDSKTRRFLKLLIISAPGIISIYYIIYHKLFNLVLYPFQAAHLTYLSQCRGLTYFSMALKLIISAISWQLFGVSRIIVHSFFGLPAGLPFIMASALFLICSIFILIAAIKRRYAAEAAVLGIFIYSALACTLLSTRGLAPLGPFRHNLFLSPALIISFFICARYAYQALNRGLLNKGLLKIKEGIFLMPLLAFLLLPNIAKDYIMVTRSKGREDLRVLLQKIQPTVEKNDKVSLYITEWGIPVLKYEHKYSNIPWLKKLSHNDISTDLSFRAGADSGYDYQWYIIANTFRESAKIEEAKALLKKEGHIVVDKEYFLPQAGVAGFRAKEEITGNP